MAINVQKIIDDAVTNTQPKKDGLQVDPQTKRPLATDVKEAVNQTTAPANPVLSFGTDNLPTITADTLNSTETPIALTQPEPATGVSGMMAEIESATADPEPNSAEALTETATASEKPADEAFTDLIRGLTQTKSETELTVEAERQVGLPDIQVELDDINQQIRQEQHGLRRRLEALEKNPQGLFGPTALADRMADEETKSLRKQADLYIIQQGVQGRFDSAKAIADRAVTIQFERQRNLNTALQANYQRLQSQFTQDEQRAFEAAQSERNRKLDAEERELQSISDLSLNAMRNGAPTSVVTQMRNASSLTDAMAVGGQYVDLLDRQAKLQQISASRTSQLLALANAGDTDAIETLGFDPKSVEEELDPTTKRQLNTTVEGTDELLDLANQYKTLVETYGYSNDFFGNKKVIGQISSLRAQMTAAYKKAKTLGTLDAGVITLMDSLLGEEPVSGGIVATLLPGGKPGIFTNLTGRKSTQIVASIDTLIDSMEKEKAKAQLRLGIDPMLEPLPEEDNAEVNAAYEIPEPFSPANYY